MEGYDQAGVGVGCHEYGGPVSSGLLEQFTAKLRERKCRLERLMNAAEHACRELGSVKAHLKGTLLEDEGSLRTQIEMTIEELRAALNDCRSG